MNWDKFKKFNYKKFFYNLFVGSTTARKIFMFYLYAIVLGTIFLSLPISLNEHGNAILGDGARRPYTFIDAFFIAVSAFTDTGLTTVNVLGTYNIFGQIVILILIQLGGLGMFTLYWLIWNMIFNSLIYKKIKHLPLNRNNTMGFSRVVLLDSERGNTKLGLSIQTVKIAITFIFITEIIFAIIYSLMFALIPSYIQVDFTTLQPSIAGLQNYNLIDSGVWFVDSNQYNHFYQNAGLSIWTGIFQSVSTMNNAGFDIIGQASYSPFRNGIWTIFLYVSALQIIIGGIGYPVIYDVINYFRKRYHHQKFRFSLFTKVTVITYFIVFAIGCIFFFGIELGSSNTGLLYELQKNNDLYEKYFGNEPHLRNWNIFTSYFYNVISTRSNGSFTISQNNLSYSTKWIINLLMFIGCSPSSTGGGIRTTTLAVLFMAIVSYMRGYDMTKIFKKIVPKSTVIMSSITIVISVTLVFGFSFISFPLVTKITNDVISITDILYEFSSCFGTVGLSSGITGMLGNQTHFIAYLILIFMSIVMIIGQLGVSTCVSMLRPKGVNKPITYPIEDIRI